MFGSDNPIGLIKRPVGNNMENDQKDVLTVKKRFADQGYYNQPIENGYIDRELDTAIWFFQKDNDLKQDGYMNPDGETESTLRFKSASNLAEEENEKEQPEPKNPEESPQEKPGAPPKPEKQNRKSCEELSIELANEKLQYAFLQKRHSQLSNEHNEALNAWRDVFDERIQATNNGLFETGASALGSGKIVSKVVGSVGSASLAQKNIIELRKEEKKLKENYQELQIILKNIKNSKDYRAE